MISACDLLPTILKLTGLSDKQPTGLPGRSFTELLEGRQLEHRDEVVIFDEYGPVRMIRTKEWKYVHRYPYGKHELYHLVDDPGEEKNLYGLPEYKKLVTQLKGRMEKWFCTYSDPAIDGVRSAVNGSGQLCRQRFTVRQLWHFRGKNQILFAAMTCPKSFSNRPPSVLTGCRVIIFLKETDIASDVGVADLLADRLDRVGSVGQQREGTFRAVAV